MTELPWAPRWTAPDVASATDSPSPVRDAMVGLSRAGMSPKDISSLSGRRPSTVRGRLSEARRLGIDVPRHQSADAERLSESARQIVELRRAGVPNAAIAERLGLTVRNLEERIRRMRRAGVNIPRRGPGGAEPEPVDSRHE